MILHYTIVSAYFATLALLMIYCMHRYYILFLYFSHKRNIPPVSYCRGKLPPITVQLPIYNEMYVIQRLLDAVVKMDYPRELLEIQVLDDSTDETSRIAQEHIAQLTRHGHNITYLHRTVRKGFKAGALQAGLKLARGELIAIFDADFVPREDFLVKMVPFFLNTKVGMVQSRWGHINRNYSILTHLQSILLDAHFILEHTARNCSGRFFNFNGTAGMWRKECIVSAGGWQHETLTEDLDLSYRAQMKGWKFIFLPQVVTPGEIPVDINSFKSQQHRWAKGGIQTAMKLLFSIMTSSQPLKVKAESFFHLTSNMNYFFIILLSLLTYPSLVVRIQMGWRNLFIFDLLCFLCSVLPICLFYVISQKEAGEQYLYKIIFLPFLISLGIGLCINNGKAVLEALIGYKSAFLRTPKFHIEDKTDTWKHKKYRGYTRSVQVMVEFALGVYSLCAIVFALQFRVYASIPFLFLFCSGFFYVSLLSLYETYIAKRVQAVHLDTQSQKAA